MGTSEKCWSKRKKKNRVGRRDGGAGNGEKVACSRLSDNGGKRKIGASEKKRRGIMDGGAGAGEREEEGEPVRLSLLTLFRPLLSPTWIIGFLLSRCVNLLKSFSDFSRE